MSSKLTAAAGFGLIILTSQASALPSAPISGGTPMVVSSLVLAQAQPAPAGAPATTERQGGHAVIEWAKARLSEIDATITTIEVDARNLDGDARRRADDTLAKLRANRNAYQAEIETFAADARQATAAQVAEKRAALEARWGVFERDLDGYLSRLASDAALRKAVFTARIGAEEAYWQRTIADLKASAATFTAERRAEIDAAIVKLQAQTDAAKAKLAKLEQAGSQAWSALRDGLADARGVFDKTRDAVQEAIERARK